MEAGSDLSIKNLAEKTPEGIIDNEIEVYSGYVSSQEKDLPLERLRMIKTLF